MEEIQNKEETDMTYLLIHSYSELNKGDAGIILATVQNIRKQDENAKIYLYSTYGYNDLQFKEQHTFLKQYVEGIVPAIFPELFLKIGSKHYYGSKAKAIALLWHLFRSSLILLSPVTFSFLLQKEEKNSMKIMQESDFVISKGGSFLCNEGSNREFFALIRLFHPFFLAKKLQKRTLILGQSLGPVKGYFSQLFFRKSIKFVDEIYIRETKTLDLLKEDNIILTNTHLVPDMAFALCDNDGLIDEIVSTGTHFKVGMTIVDFPFKDQREKNSYMQAMCDAMVYLIDNHDAKIYIYPQVITKFPDGTTDMRLTQQIYNLVPHHKKKSVIVLTDNYSPMDLKKMYGLMNIFIATRLHSAIFATGNFVPTLNISYHGTKSEGTFQLLNLEEWIYRITDVNSKDLISKIELLIKKQDEIKSKLKIKAPELKKQIENTFLTIIKD